MLENEITEEDVGSWYVDGAGDYFYFEEFAAYDTKTPIHGYVFYKNPTTSGAEFYSEEHSVTGSNQFGLQDHSLVRKLDPIEVNLLRLKKRKELLNDRRY